MSHVSGGSLSFPSWPRVSLKPKVCPADKGDGGFAVAVSGFFVPEFRGDVFADSEHCGAKTLKILQIFKSSVGSCEIFVSVLC